MTASAASPKRFLCWSVVAALLVGLLAGGALFYFSQRGKKEKSVVAYLLPVDDTSRYKQDWRPAKPLVAPLTLRAAERVSLPAGARALLVDAATGSTQVVEGPRKIETPPPASPPDSVLALPLPDLVAIGKKSPSPAGPLVVFTSPVGVTRSLNPQIAWTAEEGKTYDVAVLDPADPYVPPRVATQVRPPVSLSELETPQRRQLAPDRNYEILVRETGSPQLAGGARFLTSADARVDHRPPERPADLAAEIFAALSKKPYRTGDAWLAFAQLPETWKHSEFGLRLRLKLAVELGHAAEFNRAVEEAARLR